MSCKEQLLRLPGTRLTDIFANRHIDQTLQLHMQLRTAHAHPHAHIVHTEVAVTDILLNDTADIAQQLFVLAVVGYHADVECRRLVEQSAVVVARLQGVLHLQQ